MILSTSLKLTVKGITYKLREHFPVRQDLPRLESNQKETPMMIKTITEIMGGAQILMWISFDFQDSCEQILT